MDDTKNEDLTPYYGSYVGMGETTTAEEILGALESKDFGLGHAFMVACAHFALGNLDEGFAWLERSYQARDPGLRLLKVHPGGDSTRSDPRFEDYLTKMGFPDEAHPQDVPATPEPKQAR